MASTIGMMDSAYFVGRNEILCWINDRLHLNLSRIEEHVEVNRIVKGRPLYNLEFLQWLKRYCASINGGMMNENYNPVERASKLGKERSWKAFNKKTKSLQSNNSRNDPGDGIGVNKISG